MGATRVVCVGGSPGSVAGRWRIGHREICGGMRRGMRKEVQGDGRSGLSGRVGEPALEFSYLSKEVASWR